MMGWYIATLPLAWVFFTCAIYAHEQREFPSIALQFRPMDSTYAIGIGAVMSLLWPVFSVLGFFMLSHYKHGLAVPFTDPFKKEKQDGNRQAAQARQGGATYAASSGAGGASPFQNSGGAGAGQGASQNNGCVIRQNPATMQWEVDLAPGASVWIDGTQFTNTSLIPFRYTCDWSKRVTSFPQGAGGGGLGYANNLNSALQQAYNQARVLQGLQGGPGQQSPADGQVTTSAPPLPTSTVFGELIGWRAWKVLKGAVLSSCVVQDVWLPGVAMEGPIKDEHQAGSGEGIHAYKQEPNKDVYAGDGSGQVYATGSVWLYGDVIEHEEGYRADHAMVRSIDAVTNGDEALLAKLRERYLPQAKEPKE